jgi:hypothetical protein
MAGRGVRGTVGLAASVAFAAALAACSASNSTTPGGGSSSPTLSSAPASAVPAGPIGKPNSCNVITMSEASTALGGQQVAPPIRGHAYVEGGVACVFYGPKAPTSVSPDVPIGDTVRVVLVVGPKAKKYFDDYRSKVHAQAITGIGDAAYYDGFASISVLKGDAYLRIFVGVANPLSAEEVLAKDALPRM